MFSELQTIGYTCEISCLLLTRAVANNAHSPYLLHKILPSVDVQPVVQNGLEHFPNSCVNVIQ